MKRLLVVTAMFALAAVLAGCGGQSEQEDRERNEMTAETGEAQEEPAAEVGEMPMTHMVFTEAPVAYANRQDFMTRMDDAMRAVDQEMGRVEQRIVEMPEQARGTVMEMFDAVKGHREQMAASYEELRTASEEQWDSRYRDLHQKYAAVEDGLENLKKQLASPEHGGM